MFIDLDSMIGDLERRLSKEKSLKNRVLLEGAIASLKQFEKNNQ